MPLAAGRNLRALRCRVRDVLLDLLDRAHVDERPLLRAVLQPVADLEPADLFGHPGGERVVDPVLYQHPVGAHAGLPGVAILRSHCSRHRRVEVRVVEHDERGIAAELQADLLHRGGALCHQQLADLGGAGERELATVGFAVSSAPIGPDGPVMTLMTPGGIPARPARSARASAENGVCEAGRMTTGQPAARAGAHLRVIMAAGKFQGVIEATTPIGCFSTTIRFPGSG